MPRPKSSSSQQLAAWKMHLAKIGPTAIVESLEEEFDDPVSKRTVDTWISGFKGVPPEVKKLDSPFVFHKMEEYGLPWEAGAYLLDMWACMTEYWGHVDTGLDEPPRKWTVRQSRWWWRIHLAVPDADYLDINLWAEYVVRRELIRDVLGEQMDLTSMEAYLAYGPWRGSVQLDIYNKAIDEKRILSEFDARGEYQQAKRAQRVIGMDDLVHYAWQPSDPPGDSPSKAFGKNLETNRRLKLARRELKQQENDQ